MWFGFEFILQLEDANTKCMRDLEDSQKDKENLNVQIVTLQKGELLINVSI